MSNDTQPEIRLPGFTEAWEQRKLGEVTQIIDTKHATAPISENKSKYKMIRTSSVRHGQLYPLKMDNVTEEVYETWSERIHLQAGDVVFSREAPMGESAVIPSDKNKYFLGQRMVAIRCYENINPYFIVSTFLAPKFRKEINIRNAESTTVANFGISSLKIYKIDLPSIREQTMIGHLFQQLDDTIALHQRKLDLLKETKKGFLQKMFPKNGAKVPEIRFPGFTEDWEERKLGEFLIVPQNIKADVRSTDDLMTVKLNLGGVSSGSNRETLSLGSTAYYERRAGQFIYGKQNFFNGSMAIIPEELDGKATSGDVPALNIININTQYLYVYISRTEYWRRKEAAASGTGSKRIHESVLQGFEIDVPTDKEQQKIGTFFKQLDDTITLHQRKLDLLKETKKGFLQKMFV